MRWQGKEESSNVEDRRGVSVGRIGGIGGVGAIVVALISLYLGKDPNTVLNELAQSGTPSQETEGNYQESAHEAESRHFVGVVLKETERAWHDLFAARNATYQEPHLVLFSGAVQSACGTADAAVGPFYCPGDQQVYIDLSFYDDLKNRFGAPGDFAQAYVVAHEVGHHVQNLLGISGKVHAAQQSNPARANQLSVQMELQADCYAGIWAHYADQSRQLIEAGDIQEGLTAAAAIGDDRLQMQSRGYVSPESFTHGTSEQRVHWFKRGLESGKLDDCNTFATSAKRSQ
jgi:uncharacterized protein